ncbi:MAG: cytochrome monooxygenase [Rhodospirillales bacterium]|nr:cytochrome monooxygenase [Rhodospirillales bacterium]
MTAGERPMERDIIYPEINFATDRLPNIQALMGSLREEGRFFPVNRHGEKALLVTRFDDVSFAFGDEKDIPLSAGAKRFAEPAQGRSLFSMTGDEHRTHRALVSSAFTASAIDRYEHDIMVPEARGALGRLVLAKGGRADLIGDFAEMYGISVIVRILGLPVEDDRKFKRWAHDLTASSWALEDALKASREFEDYVIPIIQERRRGSGDDFLSRLARTEIDGKRLEDIDIVSFLRVLFPAGADTTFRQLGNLIVAMLTIPSLKQKLLEDRSLVPQAIDEALRWEPAIGLYPRLVPHDVEWRGAFIPANTFLLLSVVSANRDPRMFEDPETFDLTRRTKKITTFGAGIHFCIGAVLARREMNVAINAILDLYPDLELVDPENTRITGATLRGPAELRVRLV